VTVNLAQELKLIPVVGLGCKLKESLLLHFAQKWTNLNHSLLMSSWQISVKQNTKHRSQQDLSGASLAARNQQTLTKQQGFKEALNLDISNKSTTADKCNSLSSC